MSAVETLRRAADEIRADFGPFPDGTDGNEFMLAVADWLTAAAVVMEVAPHKHRAHALAVARAYLGEAS